MLLNEMLIGLILAAGLPLGHMLYIWSAEEVDYSIKRFKLLDKAEKIILPFAVASGILSAYFAKQLEVILVLLLLNIIFSSLAIKDRKQILLPTVVFLIAFSVTYFVLLRI